MPAETASKRQEWNHIPETPIQVSPLWQWPPKPVAAFRWYFECNYGNLDVPWDKLFGSWHDGTAKGKARLAERLKARRRT